MKSPAARQQKKINRDAAAGRRRTKAYREEAERARLENEKNRATARLEIARRIHERLGPETFLRLLDGLVADSRKAEIESDDVLFALGKLLRPVHGEAES